jgi:hypothetical protein
MSALLHRVRGSGSQATSTSAPGRSAAESPSAKPSGPGKPAQQPGRSAQPPSRSVVRKKLPERPADRAAMRDLAISSTREAVARHFARRTAITAVGRVATAAACFGTALVAWWLAPEGSFARVFGVPVALIGTIFFLLQAARMGWQVWRTLAANTARRFLSGVCSANAKSGADPPAAPAASADTAAPTHPA